MDVTVYLKSSLLIYLKNIKTTLKNASINVSLSKTLSFHYWCPKGLLEKKTILRCRYLPFCMYYFLTCTFFFQFAPCLSHNDKRQTNVITKSEEKMFGLNIF